MRYELGLYIPEDAILHSHRRENLKSYILVFHFYILCTLATYTSEKILLKIIIIIIIIIKEEQGGLAGLLSRTKAFVTLHVLREALDIVADRCYQASVSTSGSTVQGRGTVL
jgi:hypothetical protein